MHLHPAPDEYGEAFGGGDPVFARVKCRQFAFRHGLGLGKLPFRALTTERHVSMHHPLAVDPAPKSRVIFADEQPGPTVGRATRLLEVEAGLAIFEVQRTEPVRMGEALPQRDSSRCRQIRHKRNQFVSSARRGDAVP